MTRLRITRLFSCGDLRIGAVERIELETHRGRRACQVHARITPRAVVIADPGGLRAIDVHGEPIAIDVLEAEVPGLLAQLDARLDTR